VKIRVAASRDRPEKLYVQHLIRQDKELIKEWVADRRGWLYVCGSSNAMPREVREAVAWCVSRDGAGPLDGMDEDAAKIYVDKMFDDGRGGEESW
jgi:sulfite reductase alpha subunit-like flavoprotein